jgi:hypothetical protein
MTDTARLFRLPAPGRRSASRSFPRGGSSRAAIFFALLLGAGLMAVIPAAAATTVYVDVTGDDSGSCTVSAPCRTIGQAQSVGGSGALIVVGPGRFNETISIAGGSLTIQGIPGRTVLSPVDEGTACDTGQSGGNGVENTGGNLTLLGLDVDHFGGSGLSVTSGTTTTFSYGTISCNSDSGVYADDVVGIDHSTVTGNTTGVTVTASGSVTVDESLVSANTGAGIDSAGASVVRNSTVDGNGGDGVNVTGTADLSFATISDNGDYGVEGPATATGTLIAGNTTASCSEGLNSNGYNLSFNDSGANPCNLLTFLGDIVDGNPRLGPLQDNGGQTPTRAVGATSAAYRTALASGCPATDQRDVSRPQPASGSFCNIGAFETSAASKLGFETAPLSGSASSGATLGPITVRLLDESDNPTPSAGFRTISLSATAPGGVFALTPGGSPTTTVGVPAGSTGATFYFGAPTAGTPTITAASSGLTPASQTVAITPATPDSVTLQPSTSPQSAQVGATFGVPLAVRVLDAGGNPVSGVSVLFEAPATGPSGRFSSNQLTETVSTNASGVATASAFRANAIVGDDYPVTATAGSLSASFSLSNTAGEARQMLGTFGSSPQTATIDTSYANNLSVVVKDQFDNPVPGVAVSFTAPSSGASGSFGTTPGTAVTDASGIADPGTFTANGTSGSFNVTAASPGLPSVLFALTNVSGSGSQMEAGAGTTPQTAGVNTQFGVPLSVTVTDSGGNPVSGVAVQFEAGTTGATGTFANGLATDSRTTNASGVATASAFKANKVAGSHQVVAQSSGLPTVSFDLTNGSGPATQMIAQFPSTPQSTEVGTAFATPLCVVLSDQFDNPVEGVSVTFSPPGSGPSGSFGTATPDRAASGADGISCPSTFTANSAAGNYLVTATASGLTPVQFNLTNVTGGPAAVVAQPLSTPQTTPAGSNFPKPLVVKVVDGSGNPVAGALVTFSAPLTQPSGTFTGGLTVNQEVTDAAGLASGGLLRAGFDAGTFDVTAAVTGATPATFTLTTTGLEFSPPLVDFGDVNRGERPKITVTITNRTASVVTFAGTNPIRKSGPNASLFVLAESCRRTLAPGTSCSVTVTFRPDGPAGIKQASLSFLNDAPANPQVVPIVVNYLR